MLLLYLVSMRAQGSQADWFLSMNICPFKPGFLSLSTIGICNKAFLVEGGVLCTVGCWPHYLLGAPPPLE